MGATAVIVLAVIVTLCLLGGVYYDHIAHDAPLISVVVVHYHIYVAGGTQAVRVPFTYVSYGNTVDVSWPSFRLENLVGIVTQAIAVRLGPAVAVCEAQCEPHTEYYGSDHQPCAVDGFCVIAAKTYPYTMYLPSDHQTIISFTRGLHMGDTRISGDRIIYTC